MNNSKKDEEPQQTNDYRVLFPRTLPDPEGGENEKKRIKYPRTFAGWKRVFTCAWTNYRSTWQGFMGSSDDEKEKEEEELGEIIEEEKEKVSGNVEKNVAFVKEEGPKFFEFMKQETKTFTKDDLKRWAGEQMKLATLCLNEFMGGYRSGRDGEMDKMLNEYFKEEEEVEEQISKRRRRKPKRLVRSV